uniref:Nucleolar protein 56 n=1 Tax=Elaeophora elaphi TaxID=1147741 RepID=A0A0R3RGG2_9BILA
LILVCFEIAWLLCQHASKAIEEAFRLYLTIGAFRVMNNLNFLREKPPLNWLDYFVDRKKFGKFLDLEKSDPKQLSALGNQFIEQAVISDKECDMLVRKEYDADDLAYNRCKSAQLWFCALSCFASVNWNLDLMKRCCNIMSMKALMNRLVTLCYPTKTINSSEDVLLVLTEGHAESKVEFEKPEQLFVSWLYATWLLKVDVDGRFPETVAKPTVSNPLNQFDASLIQAEQFKNCTAELRRSAEGAEKLLKRMLESSRKVHIIVPTKDCFLEALSKAPNLTNDSVSNTTSSVPVLNFQTSSIQLDNNFWTMTVILYSLMCNHFAAGKVQEIKSDLEKIVKNWPKCKKGLVHNVVVSINEDDLAGYCDAYGITHSYHHLSAPVSQSELMSATFNGKALDTLDNCSLVRRLECQRIACRSDSALVNDILAENTVSEYYNDLPATLNTLAKLAASETAISRFITVCLSLIEGKSKVQVMKEVLQFLSTKVPNFAEQLRNVYPDCSKEYIRKFRNISRRPIHPLPNVAAIKELLNGGTDVWRLIVSFDMNEIKSLFAKMTGKISVPRRFRISRMIGDVMSAAASQGNFEHINLMLGKLEQLAIIGDGTQWRTFCNECVKEMGPLGKIQEIQVRFAFDAVRVQVYLYCGILSCKVNIITDSPIQLECWHARFSRVSNNAQFVHVTQALNSTVKALIQSSMTSPVTMGKMMLHTVTFFINTSEWDFLLRSFVKLKSPFLDAAKMIAAYMTSTDPLVARQIVEGPWWHVMNSTFQELPSSRHVTLYYSKRRSDGSLVREQTKQLLTRTQFLDMLRLIKVFIDWFCIF